MARLSFDFMTLVFHLVLDKQVNSVDEFSDLEFGRAEIDQKTVPDSRRFEVAKKLRGVLIRQASTGFQFSDQLILDKKIGEKTSDQCAVLIEYLQRMLLYDLNALFDETVSKGVFVNFFQMPASKVDMDVIASLPNHFAKTQYLLIAQQFFAIHSPPSILCFLSF